MLAPRSIALQCGGKFSELTRTSAQASTIIARCCGSQGQIGDDSNLQEPPFRSRAPRARFHEKLAFSPGLGLSAVVTRRSSKLTSQRWDLYRDIARNRSLRLSLVTAQFLLRQQEEASVSPSLGDLLPNAAEWQKLVEDLAAKGISLQDVKHWAWVASGEEMSADEMLRRFLSTERPKPISLLLGLLGRQNKVFKDRELFRRLLDYIAVHYVNATLLDRSHIDDTDGSRRKLRTWNTRLNLSRSVFLILLHRLVRQTVRTWPAALPAVAKFAADYIRTMPMRDYSGVDWPRSPDFAARNLVYNRALVLFRCRTALHPVQHMRHNWNAMRLLLACGNEVHPALLLNRQSLRAVRVVLLGLSKTPSEKRNALRTARTWPPFIRDWDGTDERKTLEEYLSRSVKAGLEMLRAGYPFQEADEALGPLGGVELGSHPTVQTRSLPPKTWTGPLRNLSLYSTWAARVKATRDVREAWAMFQSPPKAGLLPNTQVYTEMFGKLFARQVRPAHENLPGDAKELWKPYTENLSSFEIARLDPPSVQELYDRMMRENLKPVGACLAVLIANAGSIKQALGYLRDGSYVREAEALVHLSINATAIHYIRRLPYAIFSAWITLLCGEPGDCSRREGIRRAIQISGAVLVSLSHRGRVFKAPWHTILKALNSPKQRQNYSLAAFMRIYNRAVSLTGLDVVLFNQLGQRVHFALAASGAAAQAQVDSNETLLRCHRELTRAFEELTRAVVPGKIGNLDLPSSYHEMTATSLYIYMRALTAYDDMAGLLRLLEWLVNAWDTHELKDDKEYKLIETIIFPHYVALLEVGKIDGDETWPLVEQLEQLKPRMKKTHGRVEEYSWTWPETGGSAYDDVQADLEATERWRLARDAENTVQESELNLDS